MQLIPAWDLWYTSSTKHQLAIPPAVCTNCWWRVWRNEAIQVPARLPVASLTGKWSWAVYVKNGFTNSFWPRYVLPALKCQGPKEEKPPWLPSQNVNGTDSVWRQSNVSETGLKSVWNQSIDHAMHFHQGGLKLFLEVSKARIQLSKSDSEAPPIMFLYVLKQVWNSLETTDPASDSDPLLLRNCHSLIAR